METPGGPHVLVVEDEAIVAAALVRGLRACGAVVIGPAASMEEAFTLIEATSRIDGALVDINLRGVLAYSVVDALLARGIRLVFTTGYEIAMIPTRYRDITVLQKPFDAEEALAILFPPD